MANRVHFAVSATMIHTMDNTTGVSQDVLVAFDDTNEKGKVLAGSADVSAPTYAAVAYAGPLDSSEVDVSAGVNVAATSKKSFFVKHLGVDSAGAAQTAELVVKISATTIASIPAGGALFFPNPSATFNLTSVGSVSLMVEHVMTD